MSKRFRVAFSFAGEKRDFVAELPAILAARFGEERILYDKFHAPEFARSNLTFHLTRLYCEEADLVVAVLCPDYAQKKWCGLEWNAIYGLINDGGVSTVMLARGDLHAEHVGLVDQRLHPGKVVLLAADRVGLRQHAAGRAELDHLGAVLAQLPDHCADRAVPAKGSEGNAASGPTSAREEHRDRVRQRAAGVDHRPQLVLGDGVDLAARR